MVIVDTCSLLYLSRFYIPFDEDDKLKSFFEQKFLSGELVMLDVILSECKLQSKGLVVRSMPFWETNKSLIVKTDNLMAPAPKKISNLLDNNLCVPFARRNLSEEAFSIQKQVFLESGDGKIVLLVLNKIHNADLLDQIVVLTDESKISNDGKPFKKLPAICEFLNVKTMTLVDYLQENNIDVKFVIPE